MIDELRQRLITGLPATDPWAIDALHDHDLETFTDFTDEELQLIQHYLLNHQRDVIYLLVSRLFEGDSADSENEDAEEDMRDEDPRSHHLLYLPVPELILSNLREELMAAVQKLQETNERQGTRTSRSQQQYCISEMSKHCFGNSESCSAELRVPSTASMKRVFGIRGQWVIRSIGLQMG
jgi:hypothetical protein